MAEPKVAYVITQGSYSDYHVLGVTLDKATAEAWTEKDGRWPYGNIEEFDVFEGPVPDKVPYLKSGVCGIDRQFLLAWPTLAFGSLGEIVNKETTLFPDDAQYGYSSRKWILEGQLVGFYAEGVEIDRVRKAVFEARSQMAANADLLDALAKAYTTVSRTRLLNDGVDHRFIPEGLNALASMLDGIETERTAPNG